MDFRKFKRADTGFGCSSQPG